MMATFYAPQTFNHAPNECSYCNKQIIVARDNHPSYAYVINTKVICRDCMVLADDYLTRKTSFEKLKQ